MSSIHHINLAAIDLNLLVVFDALMTERHVTRAGERIGLSQPATSNALARLRNLFEDDLLVRTSTGLQPTSRAIALEQPIRQVLQQIQAALEQQQSFEPQTAERIFTIGMSDYGEFVLLPKLIAKLAETAPGIRVLVKSTNRYQAPKQLDAGEIDLAVGLFLEQASWHQLKQLFQENFVCISRRNHPNNQTPITLDNYLATPHLLISTNEDMVGKVDYVLEKQNLKRQITLSVPHFLIAPFVIANSNLIATLAERIAIAYADLLDLQLHPLPLQVSGFSVSMLWHSKHENDPAHLWLRTAIVDISQSI